MPTRPTAHAIASEKLILFAARGLGSGSIPVAPGTFGTLTGFGWIWLLLIPQSLWFYLGGIIIGFFGAAWIGGQAEKILGQKDPGSIVIDEIAALPLAFLGPVVFWAHGSFTPGFGFYMNRAGWISLALTFVLFRLLDITKPLFINRSQKLPGGWGLVVDDFLAALPVIPLTWAFLKWSVADPFPGASAL